MVLLLSCWGGVARSWLWQEASTDAVSAPLQAGIITEVSTLGAEWAKLLGFSNVPTKASWIQAVGFVPSRCVWRVRTRCAIANMSSNAAREALVYSLTFSARWIIEVCTSFSIDVVDVLMIYLIYCISGVFTMCCCYMWYSYWSVRCSVQEEMLQCRCAVE